MGLVTGWDVGGAHLKAALVEDSVVRDVLQLPSLIWTDLDDLCKALELAKDRFGTSDMHAVTMTGELAEYFGSRAEGVLRISQLMQSVLPGKEIRVYAGRSGFVLPEEVNGHVDDISSANWYATAAVIARKISQGILIDIGSSTTDIIPVFESKVVSAGYTDAERLGTGELLYTGIVRTPIMAVADHVPFEGEMQRLMSERFAVMADVYRVLDWLPEDADMFPAVDDRPKDQAHSRARLARMLGRNADDHEDWQWERLAHYLADAQHASIRESLHRSLSRFDYSDDTPLVGAGVGRFVQKTLARNIERPYQDFADLVAKSADAGLRSRISTAAPAVAVGLLV